jgi:hypothetical protein
MPATVTGSSAYLPDPVLLDYADLEARHADALKELARQTHLAETAGEHLRQARAELCRLGDQLDRARRRRPHGPGLGTVLVMLALFGAGLGLGMARVPSGLAALGSTACLAEPAATRLALDRQAR